MAKREDCLPLIIVAFYMYVCITIFFINNMHVINKICRNVGEGNVPLSGCSLRGLDLWSILKCFVPHKRTHISLLL